MTPEQAILERILDIADVTALVADRVYQLKLPQSPTLPAVRVQLAQEGTGQHLRGGDGLYKTLIQVDAFAAEASGGDPYAEATEVAAAIHGDDAGSGLSAWTGVSGGSPPAIKVKATLRRNRRTYYDAEERRMVRCQQDYMVHWSYVT